MNQRQHNTRRNLRSCMWPNGTKGRRHFCPAASSGICSDLGAHLRKRVAPQTSRPELRAKGMLDRMHKVNEIIDGVFDYSF